MDSALITAGALRCEYHPCPLGVETPAPRLSWQLHSAARAQRQAAYQVLVASTPALLAADTGDLWDSERVESAHSVQVPYAGAPLHSGQRCHWKVRVWDGDGTASRYSDAAWWEMGLLHADDWQAQWIGAPLPDWGQITPKPAPLFRTEIALEQPVTAARLHMCGLGYSELYLNGQKIGDHVLDPSVTRYDLRASYVTYDVTDYLTRGANAIGVMLGTGWYNCHTKEVWNFEQAPWRDNPKLLLQLHLTLADGTTRVVTSNAEWKVGTGALVFDGLRNGETYDARLERAGWNIAGYDDRDWPLASIVPSPGGVLVSQQMPPCKVVETITPVAVTEVKPGVFVYDLGQNIAGWGQLTVSGPAGTEITLRYAERLADDGDVDQSHIGLFIKSGDCQTDRYILKGDGVEIWEPRFTYHGFQYVQMTGFPGTPTLENLRGRVVQTAFQSAGEFACANDMLNAVQRCTRWSYRGNFVGIPTDCPHREKNGWTGDALIAVETGLLNFTPAAAYTKWMADFTDVMRPSGQLPGIVPTGGWGYNWGSGPAWDSAYVQIPWAVYQYCGDLRILTEHYPHMQRYLQYMDSMATDDIVGFGLGDWCPPGHESGFGNDTAPTALTSTGYYYANAGILAQIAALLGHDDEAESYTALAARIKAAFNRTFYDAATCTYGGGEQTSQGCALYWGLVEPGEVAKALQVLVQNIEAHDNHLTFGILGAKYVLNALVMYGRTDVAYRLAAQSTFPSWGHWIAQGATTLWEAWEGNNSLNHIMFGDISAWFFKTLAGINADPAHPGFQHVIIRPHAVDGLAWARAEHDGPYGRIRSAWQRTPDTFTLEVTIPANSTATVYLPVNDPASVREGDQPLLDAAGITVLDPEGDRLLLTIGSGNYRFTMPV